MYVISMNTKMSVRFNLKKIELKPLVKQWTKVKMM